MNWAKGYSAESYLSILDRYTHKDVGRIDIVDGSIKRTLDMLRESADVTVRNLSLDKETLVRIWLDVHQSGDSSHIPLFTGLAMSPSDKIVGYKRKNAVQCYSVLKFADDILLDRGWYAPGGIEGAVLIKDLLSVCGFDISIPEKSPEIKKSILAEKNETRLSMVEKILDAMGQWRLMIDGLGNIEVKPFASSYSAIFDHKLIDILEPTIDVNFDYYSCPNVLRAISDDAYAIARDDDPNSIFSTVSRGREVWHEEDVSGLNENETLGEYAYRKLKEYQNDSYKTVSYTRRFVPDIYPSDHVQLNLLGIGGGKESEWVDVKGDFVVTSQTLSIGKKFSVSEEVSSTNG